jgi:F0F1-type ATP synthase membrane subunit b/b'
VSASRIIASLNALSKGEIDAIRTRLAEASAACRELGRDDLALQLDEARDAIVAADVRTYRKKVETVIARLGHLR